jgi:hypothetical protein
MSLVTVFGESFAALAFAVVIRGYELCNARESLGKRRNFIAQVNQQVSWCDLVVATADRYRGLPVATFAFDHVVWHKTAVAKRPQQIIYAFGIGAIYGVNVHGVFEPIRFLGKPARKGMARSRAGLIDKIEVDAGH